MTMCGVGAAALNQGVPRWRKWLNQAGEPSRKDVPVERHEIGANVRSQSECTL